MNCPQCQSTSYRKNGKVRNKQRYICKSCGRSFFDLSSSQLLPSVEATLVTSSHEPTQSAIALMTNTSVINKANNQKLAYGTGDDAVSYKEISILLLDAENLKLDIKAEQFLETICTFPLKVKIAFANWRNPSIGKQDVELYKRGYQLIHAPNGENAADAKMIALGSSLFMSYPSIKEVFVCSSDGILTHLCNQLQSQGLTVHWVRRQDNNLTVENCNQGKIKHYSLTMAREVPSFEELVSKVEELIKAEHEAIAEKIARLSAVANLFQERRSISIYETSSTDSKAIVEEQNLVIPKLEESTPIPIVTDVQSLSGIKSQEELEKALVKILIKLKTESPKAKVSIGSLGTNFKKLYSQSPKDILKKLEISSSLSNFLKSCPLFIVENDECVELAQGSLLKINSRAELEQALVSLYNDLIAKSEQSYLSIGDLGTAFKNHYDRAVTDVMKNLKVQGSFSQFLLSCKVFQVEKKDNKYQVILTTT